MLPRRTGPRNTIAPISSCLRASRSFPRRRTRSKWRVRRRASLGAWAGVGVAGHVVLQTEVAALGLPLWRQQDGVRAELGRLFLKVSEVVVGDGTHCAAALNPALLVDDEHAAGLLRGGAPPQ